MAVTRLSANTPVSSTTSATDKPGGTTPAAGTLPPNTADTTPPPADTSGADMMRQAMQGMMMSQFQEAQADAKKEDQEFEDEMKEEDARNGIE